MRSLLLILLLVKTLFRLPQNREKTTAMLGNEVKKVITANLILKTGMPQHPLCKDIAIYHAVVSEPYADHHSKVNLIVKSHDEERKAELMNFCVARVEDRIDNLKRLAKKTCETNQNLLSSTPFKAADSILKISVHILIVPPLNTLK